MDGNYSPAAKRDLGGRSAFRESEMKKYLIGVIAALATVIVSGPIGLALLVIGGLFFNRFLNQRGKLFVQAYCYLQFLEEGQSQEDANHKALSMGLDEISYYVDEAMFASNTNFGGETQPMITLAKVRGFSGGGWMDRFRATSR